MEASHVHALVASSVELHPPALVTLYSVITTVYHTGSGELHYPPLTPLPCAGCSSMEQKVDQMAAELTKRQLEREDTALQYKR